MAKVVIVCWQDIPSLVEVRDGASVSKQPLSARFQELIDIVAMRKKLVGTDAYLEQWNRRKDAERPGDVDAVAAAVATELEGKYEEIKAAAIAQIKEI
jgi:Tat protein secretion system quality control protein TatD with DNase activity